MFLASYNPCKNGGTPTFQQGSLTGYTCSCLPNYNGQSCEYNNTCFNNKCKNGASCLQLEEGSSSYLCICTPGYSGDLCDNSQICVDQNPTICANFVNNLSLCSTASYNNILISTLCTKTCGLCSK